MQGMTIVIVLALVAIVASLAGAGWFMLRRGSDPAARPSRMAQVLALRVGLSVALFLFVLLSWWMGWIHPGGLPVQR